MQSENSKFKIEFYKRLIRFSLEIIKLCQEIRKDRNLWTIADQLIRSATSIGANVVETKASSSKLDYLRFFHFALKSANEMKYWLILIQSSDLKIQNKKTIKHQINSLLKEADEIANYWSWCFNNERQEIIFNFKLSF